MKAGLIVTLFILFAATALPALEVIDDIGRPLQLEQPATRIISLAPHITENLFAAGLGHLLVGVVSYSDYPQQAQSIPRVGAYNNINIELIISLQPDLIIAWKEGNQRQQFEKLEALGLTIYVNEPRALADIATSMRHFGILTGQEESAELASRDFLDRLAALQRQYSDKEEISVFYQAWNRPLLTVNDRQSIGRIIRLCGGRNIFAELPTLSPQVSMESVIARDPQVIIASGMSESRPEWLDDWKRWPFLQAVKHDHLFFVPPDIIQRHSPRILQGAALICHALQQVREGLPG